MFFPTVSLAISSTPVTSSFDGISSASTSTSGPLVALDMSLQSLASIIQAVKLALAAQQAPVSSVEMPVSCAVFPGVVEISLVSAHVGMSAQDLGMQVSAFLASRRVVRNSHHKPQSNRLKVGQAFVVPSFIPTFSTANPLLVIPHVDHHCMCSPFSVLNFCAIPSSSGSPPALHCRPQFFFDPGEVG